ncbi:hypothetical protein ACQE3E_19245 [Methylomonas sp. MED-D]|uniref:hypothetical protein n=1 Tax=Methylomonas TaxID=416 RepID=UPI000B03687F|nr:MULTISPECIES: hypothetical protein [Methylomonas]MDT4332418.1 hypothetical protein [Methylomonas sp. MV1]NJA08084.1 hypothetical protein [Methylococcaceae bacterium WWC4]WGS85412.1 hypothetical protein QC632_20615 [Methylomonas sp. UP202]
MSNLQRDILTGLIFVTGLVGFFSGEYIISSALFAASTYASNLGGDDRKNHSK